VLLKKGVPAAVFVVSDMVGSEQIHAHDRLYQLLSRRYQADGGSPTPFEATRLLLDHLPQAEIERVMTRLEATAPAAGEAHQPFQTLTWEMLARVRRAGMTVGSHTRTHVLLTNENRERVTEEVAGSRRMLEERLGEEVRHFAYPNGCFNTASVDAVAEAGYRLGYTTCHHHDAARPRLTVGRTVLWQHSSCDARGRFSGPVLSCQIHQAFALINGCRQSHNGRHGHSHG